MYGYHVRTVEERLVAREWSHPKSRLLLVPALTLGTLTFVWFWIRGKLDEDDAGRYELWATIWGVVNAAGMPYGGGLLFGTPDELVASTVIWLLRLTSIVHAWAANRDRLERIARREVGVESAMLALAANGGRRQPDRAPRFPTFTGPDAPEAERGMTGRTEAGMPAPPVPTGTHEALAPARPVRPAPPVDPARAARVLETPPEETAPTFGNVPIDTAPDVEPEPQRWMPMAPPRPGDPHAPRRGPGRRLDL